MVLKIKMLGQVHEIRSKIAQSPNRPISPPYHSFFFARSLTSAHPRDLLHLPAGLRWWQGDRRVR
jgi:hypothetical protein